MQKPVLVIMAAGMGSRYGGLKQIDPIDDQGHIIMDFSIFDSFDMSVFTFFGEQIQNAAMNIVANFITFFGGSEFVIPMAVVGLVLSFFKKTRKFGMSVLFAVLSLRIGQLTLLRGEELTQMGATPVKPEQLSDFAALQPSAQSFL
mgnify:CR=1 FL=1